MMEKSENSKSPFKKEVFLNITINQQQQSVSRCGLRNSKYLQQQQQQHNNNNNNIRFVSKASLPKCY
jgi:hypothetical protein